MKVLLVDDDEAARLIGAKALSGSRYEVRTAASGAEALEMIRREGLQIVVTDWNMPGMDGLELCRRLRSSPAIHYIYIVIVTARTAKADLLAGLAAGADDFISKPIEPAELLLRVRTAERILAQESTGVTLFSLAKLAESRDPDTGAHLDRIREYSRFLARRWMARPDVGPSLPPRFHELVFETSPLHDIGKVGIPDFVLLKRDRLSEDERRIMRTHPEIGARTLDAALARFPQAESLRMARDIAWAHHERWDGGGYPRGLRGEGIPLGARIVALADVYDALTMKRVYKAVQTHEQARETIRAGAGAQFDPRLVEIFLDGQEEFRRIREKYDDAETAGDPYAGNPDPAA